jgi:acylphosphatase
MNAIAAPRTRPIINQMEVIGPTRIARGADGRNNSPVPEDIVRRRVVVHGRVQGVFFRDSARERANAHGVAGWVRNRSDGAVEAVLEGPPDAVDRVARFFETGPAQASVDQLEVEEESPEGLTGFEVR